jgi:pimeloyl-ACP methyl ester carboxylesterase
MRGVLSRNDPSEPYKRERALARRTLFPPILAEDAAQRLTKPADRGGGAHCIQYIGSMDIRRSGSWTRYLWTMAATLAAVVLIVVLLATMGVLYQRLGAPRDLQRYPAPGRLFDVHGTRLHIHVQGSGAPAVIFEAGVAASSVSWRPVQEAVSTFTATAAYDRAGFAWSGLGSRRQSPAEMNESLRTLLQLAGLEPPFVLVGHSFGALLMRLYAAQWPEDVAGLVLVDPPLLQEWGSPAPARLKMLGRGVSLSRRGALLARIGFVRLSLALLTSGLRFLPKLISKISSGKGHAVSSRLVVEVRKLPPELWPAVQSHWCRPESFESMARHLECLPATAALVAQTQPLGRIPVTVISGSHLSPAQQAEHAAIAASSENGRHIVSIDSGHWVHLDDPATVIDAIREMVRRGTESHHG